MRTPIVFSVLLLAAAPAAVAGEAGTDAPIPVIRFAETTHDLGTLAADAKVSFHWEFTNAGKAPLEIVNTFPSCGCTASVIETKAIEPGGKGSLGITFDAKGLAGDVRRTITVITNSPKHPNTILTLVGKVTPPVNPRVSAGHPPIVGQSMLVGSCGTCHAAPAAGKSGEALWGAVCAMCHGPKAEGKLAPGLRAAGYLAGHDDKALADAIGFGTTNARMPGFSSLMGGPLDPAQVDSLVKLIRTWGPADSAPAAVRPAAGH